MYVNLICRQYSADELSRIIGPMRRPIIIGTLSLLCLILALAFVAHRVSPSAPDANTASRDTLTKYWTARITHIGPKAAYAEAVQLAPTIAPSASHKLGHLLGDLIYSASGEKAMGICDTQFLYGCFHQVLARALEEGGVARIASLIDQCPRSEQSPINTGCHHGAGHGLLAYFGYSTEGLTKALAACPRATPEEEYFACEQGAHMEYEFNTMSTQKTRAFDPVHPKAPCDALPAAFQTICVFAAAHWWQHAGAPLPTESLALLGTRCIQTTASPALRTACFAGLGYGVPDLADFSTERISTLCSTVSTAPRDQAICTICAAHTVSGVQPETLPALCDGLSVPARDLCLQNRCNPDALAGLK